MCRLMVPIQKVTVIVSLFLCPVLNIAAIAALVSHLYLLLSYLGYTFRRSTHYWLQGDPLPPAQSPSSVTKLPTVTVPTAPGKGTIKGKGKGKGKDVGSLGTRARKRRNIRK